MAVVRLPRISGSALKSCQGLPPGVSRDCRQGSSKPASKDRRQVSPETAARDHARSTPTSCLCQEPPRPLSSDTRIAKDSCKGSPKTAARDRQGLPGTAKDRRQGSSETAARDCIAIAKIAPPRGSDTASPSPPPRNGLTMEAPSFESGFLSCSSPAHTVRPHATKDKEEDLLVTEDRVEEDILARLRNLALPRSATAPRFAWSSYYRDARAPTSLLIARLPGVVAAGLHSTPAL